MPTVRHLRARALSVLALAPIATFAALLVPAPASAATSTAAATVDPASIAPIVSMQVDGQIVIAPDGALRSYEVTSKVLPVVAERLKAIAAGWRFDPVLVDGKAVTAATHMRVTLAAQEVEGGSTKVRIDNVTFPDENEPGMARTDAQRAVRITPRVMRKPGFPETGISNLNGLVLLYVRLDAEGNVLSADAVQSSLYDLKGDPRKIAQLIRTLEKSALAAARQWTFDIAVDPTLAGPDAAANAAKGYAVAVPILYSQEGWRAPRPGEWRAELRTPWRRPAWASDADMRNRMGTSDLGSAATVTLAGGIALASDVSGQLL